MARPRPLRATTSGSITGSAYFARSRSTTWNASAATASRLDWNQKSVSKAFCWSMLTSALAPMPTRKGEYEQQQFHVASWLGHGVGVAHWPPSQVAVGVALPRRRRWLSAMPWVWGVEVGLWRCRGCRFRRAVPWPSGGCR